MTHDDPAAPTHPDDTRRAMAQGWASAPVLAAILEQLGGSVGIDPLDVERHARDGTTPRFQVEDTPRRMIAARLPEPGDPDRPAPDIDRCPTCGRTVVWLRDGCAHPCGHPVLITHHAVPADEPDRYELTAVPDRGEAHRRAWRPSR